MYINLDEKALEYAKDKNAYVKFQEFHIQDFKAGAHFMVEKLLPTIIEAKDFMEQNGNEEEAEELYNIIENLIDLLPNSFDKFSEKYTIINNGEENQLFETFGEDLEKVKSTSINQIWTICDEDGMSFIYPGMRIVNRLGYLVTKESWTDPNEFYYY